MSINLFIKIVIGYFILSGSFLLMNEVPESMNSETIYIGLTQYILSPFFLVVRLFFTKTIESNSFLINFLGILNILTAVILTKIKFNLKLIP